MVFISRHQEKRSLAASVTRAMIAVAIALSCLATLVPAGLSSSPQTMMDCCVGHEAGSCSSGLLSSSQADRPEGSADHEHDGGTATFEVSAGVHAQPAEIAKPVKATESETARVDTVTRACSGECGACSTSFNRQPRPREHSTLATKDRLHLQTSSRIRYAESLHVNTLQRVATQLRPRAPPGPPV